MTEGFWSTFGAAASVDWCEPNYVVTPYIAEFWNTLSSLGIAAFGVAGVVHCARAGRRVEPRFWGSFVALAVIGLGSAGFHGTLLKYPQATDELPMVWASLLFVYMVRFRQPREDDQRKRPLWLVGLWLYALGFTAAYFTLETYFTFFIWTYAALVTYVTVQMLRVSWRGGELRRKLFAWAAGSYVGGVALLWIPEHLVLACEHPLQAAQLHAFFHITSAVGTYAWILWALADRAMNLGDTPRVEGLVPFVAVETGAQR